MYPERFRVGVALAMLICVGICHGVALADETLVERRQAVEKMSPEEKARLARKQEQFAHLDPAEQQRLRTFHEELQNDPRREQLSIVIKRYHDWVKTLDPADRAELLRLPPEERLERVKQLRKQQERRKIHQLGPQDLATMGAWMERLVVAQAPPPARAEMEALPADERRTRALQEFGGQLLGGRGRALLFAAMGDLASLRESLSPEARAWLENAPRGPDKFRLIAGWSLQAARAGLGEERLFELAAKDLPPADRQHYERLSPEQRLQWLQRRVREENSWRGGRRYSHRYGSDKSRRGYGPRGNPSGRKRGAPPGRDFRGRAPREDRT